MSNKEKVTNVIFAAIDELNQLMPSDQQLEKSFDTVLVGNSGNLDSQGVVNLIVELEQRLEEEFSANISLADDKAIFEEDGPLATIETLTQYICSLLERASSEQ